MTVAPIGNGMYIGASTDTKPTTGVTTGALFFENNTGVISYYNGTTWTAVAGGGGGSGEANTASNTGTVGTGLFKTKSTYDLQFYKINSQNNLLTIALNGTDRVDLTVNQANLAIAYSQLTSVPSNIAKTDQTQTITGLNTFDQRQIIKALASTPTDPPSGYTTVYAKTKDASNEGIFAKLKVAGTVSEVELGVADEVLALNELSDVTITTPADKHFLVYNSGSSLFVNRLLATADLPTINATTNTITDTSTATGDILKSNGTKFVRFARSGTGGQVLRTNPGGTDLEWATISAGGGDVYLANANVFTNVQKINVDNGTQITFYRPVNTAGFGAGFSYDFNNSSSAEVNYAQQYVSIESNTAGAHRGDFNIQLAIAASLGIRFRVYTAGNGGLIFGNNQRIQIDETGLSAARIFTFPDAAGEIGITTATQTQTNKTIVAASNTITDTSASTGDIFRFNGTRFVRMARGTAFQVLRTNSGATDIEYASLNSENAGTALASGNGSTTSFNVAHGLGSTPYMAHIQCSTHTNVFTYTYDATNITVVFTTAPPSGTNNVKFQWRAIL